MVRQAHTGCVEKRGLGPVLQAQQPPAHHLVEKLHIGHGQRKLITAAADLVIVVAMLLVGDELAVIGLEGRLLAPLRVQRAGVLVRVLRKRG